MASGKGASLLRRFRCECGALISSTFGFGQCRQCGVAAIYRVEEEA